MSTQPGKAWLRCARSSVSDRGWGIAPQTGRTGSPAPYALALRHVGDHAPHRRIKTAVDLHTAGHRDAVDG